MPPRPYVLQSGNVTVDHAVAWAADGAIKDAGSPALTSITLTGDVTGSGTSTIATTINDTSIAKLNVEDQVLSGGVQVSSKSLTPGNVTIDPGDRPLQYIPNNGAFTITAPVNDGSCLLLVTNGASAGAI